MPFNDTASEAQAWDIASSYSTVLDTTSEPPRCSAKLADKIMNRAYGGMDPEESAVSPNSSHSSGKKKSSRSSSTVASKSAATRSTSARIGGSSCRHARMSDASTSKPSSKSYGSHTASSRYSRNDEDSISGRSQMSALERRLERGGNSSRTSQRKSSRPDPIESNELALVPCKHSMDPSDSSELALVTRKNSIDPKGEQASLAMYNPTDPPSTSQGYRLTTCDEEDEESTHRHGAASGTIESHYDSYRSQESGSSDSRSSYEDAGTLEDSTDSLIEKSEQHALAIRHDDDITVPSVDPRASVTRSDSDPRDAALVPSSGRYLASAVDNVAAMVPFDSTLFESYDHTFVKCPEHLRFLFLYTFLKKNSDKKIIVFFSTTNSAKFHSRLLDHFHIPCLTMHSKQKKQHFINTFFRFSDLKEGILCATDAEGRDLDIPPSVDWVVQFEPPDDPTEFILRVARISCESDRVGRSLLFLNPGEQGFLKYYHSAAIPVSEFEIPKLPDLQPQIEYHVNGSERLLKYAKEAYGSYLIAYASHSFRDVYNVHDLNKNDVAAAFGLLNLPSVANESDDETSVASGDVREIVQAAGQAPKEGTRKTWTSKKKKREKTWMKGEKSWPHCQIKVHPKFRDNYTPREEEYDD